MKVIQACRLSAFLLLLASFETIFVLQMQDYCFVEGLAQIEPTTKTFSPSKPQLPPPMIACASTTELERAIAHYGKSTDRALEIGTQFATVSAALCRTCAAVTLVEFVATTALVKSGRSTHQTRQDFGGEGGGGKYSNSAQHRQQQQQQQVIITLQDLSEWRRTPQLLAQLADCDLVVLDVTAAVGNDLALTALTLATEMSHLAIAARVVLVKSTALASLARRLVPVQRLVQSLSLSENNNNNNNNGKQFMSPDNNALWKRSSQPVILTAVGVQEYRSAIATVVQPGNACLEVGCHAGKTTNLLHQQSAAFCLGIDVSPKIIQRAAAAYPNVTFAVGNAWKTLDILRLQQELQPASCNSSNWGFDVVFADIGGLSGPHGVLESLALVDAMAHALEPRVLCIKSLCLQRLASSRLQAFTRIWNAKDNVVAVHGGASDGSNSVDSNEATNPPA